MFWPNLSCLGHVVHFTVEVHIIPTKNSQPSANSFQPSPQTLNIPQTLNLIKETEFLIHLRVIWIICVFVPNVRLQFSSQKFVVCWTSCRNATHISIGICVFLRHDCVNFLLRDLVSITWGTPARMCWARPRQQISNEFASSIQTSKKLIKINNISLINNILLFSRTWFHFL